MNAEAIYCSIWIICISQCGDIVVTLLRCTGQFCKLLSNFFSILCAKNYYNSLLFDHVIHFWRLCRSSLQFTYVAGVRKCEKNNNNSVCYEEWNYLVFKWIQVVCGIFVAEFLNFIACTLNCIMVLLMN